MTQGIQRPRRRYCYLNTGSLRRSRTREQINQQLSQISIDDASRLNSELSFYYRDLQRVVLGQAVGPSTDEQQTVEDNIYDYIVCSKIEARRLLETCSP
jgi:hypothetical protein